MSDKLQELTDRLYHEGLAKGKEEGEKFLENARAEAEAIINEAESKADAVIAAAETAAADLRAKTESDIRMASSQSLQSLKSDMEKMLLNSIIDEKVDAVLNDPDFLGRIIISVSEKFRDGGCADMSILLPEKMKSQMELWVAGELKGILEKGIQFKFSRKVQGGFNIGPKDGSYFVSMSDETFKSLISSYLRPITRKLLFGE